MIPPTASLVKYDNPVLVSRNTEKKSPRVRLAYYRYWVAMLFIFCLLAKFLDLILKTLSQFSGSSKFKK